MHELVSLVRFNIPGNIQASLMSGPIDHKENTPKCHKDRKVSWKRWVFCSKKV